MHINWQLRELNVKIVYYGPALSGKTTNLEQIYARVDPRRRSKLVSLKTQEDRTLFFDFLQLELGKVGSMTPKIHLYTVPGQIYYESSRKVVLHGADGVVFIVDSAADRLRDNLESLGKMRAQLSELQISIEKLPLVIQFNKQDLPNALSPMIIKKLLDMNGCPTISAVAKRGEGVFDTLKLIIQNVMTSIQQEMS